MRKPGTSASEHAGKRATAILPDFHEPELNASRQTVHGCVKGFVGGGKPGLNITPSERACVPVKPLELVIREVTGFSAGVYLCDSHGALLLS